MGTASGGIAPLKDSLAKLDALGKLKLPDGRRVADVKGGELARILIREGVPGVSHENGRMKNAQAYAEYLDEIAKEAAAKAVTPRLRERREGG